MRILATFVIAAFACAGADNSLTPEERRAGWRLLFDGRTMKNWADPAKKNQPGDAWIVEDGSLKTRLKPRIAEDLVTRESFGDFELLFDWRVAPGGNTGLKYRLQKEIFVDESKIQKGPGGFEGLLGREISNPQSDRSKLAPDARGFVYTVGFEFQLIDDEKHPDAQKDRRHTTGALYSFTAPTKTAARPAGEWNSSRLVVKGDQVEHWINGVQVLSASLRSEDVRAGAAKRWGQVPSIHEALTNPKPVGPLCLQHHGDEVWFKNIKIKAARR
jgi:hypothetical protein